MITLTTDFGQGDTYVGVMKGVMLSIAPSAPIVDLCHGILPQDILAGALALDEAVAFFPVGTIHLAIVDPGVGSPRSAIALETNRAFYIGPDNGIFDLVLKKEQLKRAVMLTNPRYRLPLLSNTFHGRDVFAPAAAHLFNGIAFSEFGPDVELSPKLKLPTPCAHENRLQIHILRTDHFGNIITDLTPETYASWNPTGGPLKFEFLHACFTATISATYADVPHGAPVAYFGSSGHLEIAICNGNAAGYFKAARGFSVALEKL